ncbi:DUF6479 family protein [Streptomyces indicus]|uniref:Uncharacterized protein n=1 Tax=Streptomyces indicus TaxID=417292 RepID=A0A1G8TSY7_9ACTN|nr:DUF6479 family protein [Streptomyces indicus]SDJ44494.1 hypothetical protein SAMN05421806_101431 [Streptomyces indicus]
MSNATIEGAAAQGGAMGIAMALVGLAIVGMLLGAFWWGRRRQDRAPRPPTPDEQPKLPGGRRSRTVQEMREPEEVPRDGDRLTPHQLRHSPTRSSSETERPKWSPGSSGAFGSGGPGGKQG